MRSSRTGRAIGDRRLQWRRSAAASDADRQGPLAIQVHFHNMFYAYPQRGRQMRVLSGIDMALWDLAGGGSSTSLCRSCWAAISAMRFCSIRTLRAAIF